MVSAMNYRALYIGERKSVGPTKEEADLSLALPYWRKLLDYEDEQSFLSLMDRLYQIDHQFLRSHFGGEAIESGERDSSETQHTLDWIKWVRDVWKNDQHSISVTSDYHQVMEGTQMQEFPFYTFYEPFVRTFYEDIASALQGYEMEFQRISKHDFILYYLEQLYTITHKTLMLEINYLRQEGTLKRGSPEEGYQIYVTQFLRDPTYLSNLMEEYPVMFRLMAEKTEHLKRFILEVVDRLNRDWELLTERFGVSDKTVTRIQLGSGDPHKQGRTVAIIEFACGSKVVYKPRSMSMDVMFQQFITWMNNSIDDHDPLYVVNVIDRQIYGWMEYIPYVTCRSVDELQRFYRRLGKLLAVLHLMNATDFHYENIIAYGDQPILVDLESLFRNQWVRDHDLTASGAVNQAMILIRDSVLSTGIVPFSADQDSHFDISGIGAIGEQLSPFQIQAVAGQNTDEIHLVKQFGKLSSGRNNPLGDDSGKGLGSEIMKYLDDLKEGFASGYRLFLSRRDETRNLLEKFGNCESRIILRATMVYGKLLHLSYHPDFMRNQLDREILLNRLFKLADEWNDRILLWEIADMLEGDIPYFYSTPSANWIANSRHEQLGDFFYEDALTKCYRKLDQFSEEDLAYQLHIVQSTIAAVYANEDIKMVHLANWKVEHIESINLLDKAKIIADTLIGSAITYEGEQGHEYCWTSMVTQGEKHHIWRYSVTGPGLYDGNPGIALFLAQLWRVTGEDKYREASLAAIRPIELIIEELLRPDRVNLGAYTGLAGVLYAFARLGVLLDDPAKICIAERFAADIPRHIPEDIVYDLVGGGAGSLAVLASMLELFGEDARLIHIGDQLVQHLIERAVSMQKGIAWVPANSPERPYIGFSHGNAGIAFALSRFMPWSSHQDAIESAVRAAIDYENTLYNHEVMNWYSEHLKRHPIAWCHGAPGILLSRLEARNKQIFHEHLERDIHSAVKTTLEASSGSNFSFCHGHLGNMDALLLAAPYVDAELRARIEEKRLQVLDGLFRLADVIHADINAVGIMNGLAGIGYGLLRLHDPQGIPSLLTLEMKKAVSSEIVRTA